MKVLVTGSSGLVGSAFRKVVQEEGQAEEHTYIYLTSKDGDLRNEETVRALFETHRPDALIHLAANVGGLFKNMYKKAEMLEDNLLMNTYLLREARRFQVKKVIVILSTCIFPDKVEPLTEEKLHVGPPHPSNEGYAYAKRLMEVHARILATEHQVETIVLTPTNLYGPYDNFQLDDAHVLPALIHKCYLAKKNQEPFTICGSGRPLRQFLYSEDFARIIWYMLHRPPAVSTSASYHHYICAPPSTQEVSIEYVARRIAQEMEYEYAIFFDMKSADGQYRKKVEPHPVLQDRSYVSVEQGIHDTVQWFLQNWETLRK